MHSYRPREPKGERGSAINNGVDRAALGICCRSRRACRATQAVYGRETAADSPRRRAQVARRQSAGSKILGRGLYSSTIHIKRFLLGERGTYHTGANGPVPCAIATGR